MKIVSIIILILIVTGGAFWYQGQKSKTASLPVNPQLQNEPASSGTVMQGGNSISVSNQEAGDIVNIDLIVLSEPGFVVIHQATEAGKTGKVVGYSDYLTAGQHTDIGIDLDANGKVGESYIAMLHADPDNDKQYTSTDEAMPVKDKDGNPIMTKFMIVSSTDAVPVE